MGDHAAHGREDLTEADLSPEELEAGRLLFAKPCGFVYAVATLDRLPPPGLPEVAMLGRSNVGKSSLINALTNRTDLARVSNTPGRTQQLNFFDLGGQLLLVDMPGYGHAEAPKSEIARWTKVIKQYLQGRVPLRRLVLLVDGRHGLKAIDHEQLTLLDRAAVATQVVLTKIDKVRAADQPALLAATEAGLKRHPSAFPRVLPTSAETKAGIPELRAMLAGFAI
jgi:GTP-binding protein